MRYAIVGVALLAVIFGLSGLAAQKADATEIVDHFDDGVIDPTLWVTHGYGTGFGGGGWQYSFSEVTGADSYLQARVWGPPTSGTNGQEADVLSTTNFNTGEGWLVNFTWATTINGTSPDSGNAFSISVVNSLNPPNIPDGAYWIRGDYRSGFTQLWREWDEQIGVSAGDTPVPPFSAQQWSIYFDPSGTASLYEAPNATGPAYSTVALDTSEAWYLGFFMPDFTSAGYGSGDNSFRLYSYSAESPATPEPVSIVMLGGLGAGMFIARKLRRKHKA